MRPLLLSIFLSIIILGCSTEQSTETTGLKPGDGFAEVKGGKVWYGVMGQGTKPPIICLHGGPGGTSAGFYKLSEIAKDRPVILMDQLGGGRSTVHQDTSLLLVNNFVEQVKAVKEKLNLDEYYVLGHSWGTALALEYYLQHPEGIKGLIFNSPYFSTPIWTADADTLVAALPDSIKEAIRIAEADSIFNTDSYQAANTYFLSQHGRRKESVTHPYDTANAPWSEFIYNYMWGPSEFTATGTLRNYDNHQRLKEVTVPTLFTTGEYDEARPKTVERLSRLVNNSKFATISEAGHSTMSDNTEELVAAIQSFLKDQAN